MLNIIPLAIFAVAGVSAAAKHRNINDVRRYIIYPAQPIPKAPEGISGSLPALCHKQLFEQLTNPQPPPVNPKLEDVCQKLQREFGDLWTLARDCGDGTWCGGSPCGTWLGKEKMCCFADSEANPSPDDGGDENIEDTYAFQTNACGVYHDVLSEFSLNKFTKKPMTEGCIDYQKASNITTDEQRTNYPVGDSLWHRDEIGGVKQCCPMEDDHIILLSDPRNHTTEQVGCISPLTKSPKANISHSHTENKVTIDFNKSDGPASPEASQTSDSNSTTTGETSNSTTTGASKKSDSATIVAVVGPASMLFVVAMLSSMIMYL